MDPIGYEYFEIKKGVVKWKRKGENQGSLAW